MSNGSHFQWTAGAPFNVIRFSLFALIDFVLFLSIILMNIYTAKFWQYIKPMAAWSVFEALFLGCWQATSFHTHNVYVDCVIVHNRIYATNCTRFYRSALCIAISECVFMKRKCSGMFRKKREMLIFVRIKQISVLYNVCDKLESINRFRSNMVAR